LTAAAPYSVSEDVPVSRTFCVLVTENQAKPFL
jgi:hypothetical protein